MGTFGDRLKREREMRSISLDEISHATKIGTRSLKALEEEDFQKLPGGIFNKGFVRAYARFLGIDEDEAVADYMAVAGEDPRAAVNPEQLRKAADSKKISEKKTITQPMRSAPVETGPSPLARLLPLAAFLLLAIALTAGSIQLYRRHHGNFRESFAQRIHSLKDRFEHRKDRRRNQQNSTQAANPVATPASPGTSALQQQGPPAAAAATNAEPVQVEGRSEPNARLVAPVSSVLDAKPEAAASPAKTADGEFALFIQAREQCWVSIVADGEPVVRRTLRPGGSGTTVKAHEKIKLTAGNAGGIDISINGKPQPAIGGLNEVRTVYVTANGVE